MTRTVAVGNYKEVVQVNAFPPSANIWKDNPSNILGPSPQQVEFEYTEEKEELTWGYYLNLAVSAAVAIGGLIEASEVSLRCETCDGVAVGLGYASAGAISLVGHGIYGLLVGLSDKTTTSPISHSIGASYQDSSGTSVNAGSTITFDKVTAVTTSPGTVLGFPGVAKEYVVPKKALNLGYQQVTLNLQAAQALVTQSAPNTITGAPSTTNRNLTPALPVQPAAPVFQGPKSVVAVFDIQDTRKSRRLTREQNADLTAYLTTLLTNTKRYATVPKSDLKAALSAQKAQSYDACYDESCQIDIGKEVAAEKSLATRLSKFGQKCIVAITLYDLRKSTTENAVQDRVACDQDSLITAFERLVPQLAGTQATQPSAPAPEAESNGTMF